MAFKDAEFEYYQNYLNKANTDSAKKQMDFQKMMSDTSHQREVKDLLKAGLNPALSLNNGASTPGGSYANVDSSPVTARSQQKIAQKQIDANILQTKMSLENAYKIAQLQAYTNLQASRYASQMSYAGQVYGANSAYNASVYGSDNAYEAQVYGVDQNIENKSTPGLVRQGYKYITGKDLDLNSGRTLSKDVKALGNKVKNWVNNQIQGVKFIRDKNITARKVDKAVEKATLVNNNAKAYLNYLSGKKTINQNIGTTKHLYNNKSKNK